MCGLVAIISKRPAYGFSRDELDVFKTLLHVDALRGEDSTGVFGVTNDGDVHIAKSAEISGTFINTKEYQEIDRKMFSKGFALVGHNRKATRGDINDENAHPFVVNDEVVLVHNGTWFGDHKHIANTEVDSHAFAHAIQEAAPEEVERAFERVNAAYATIWYDTRDKSINFARNTQRPLYYLSTTTAFIVSSEKEMIEFAVARCKLTLPKDAPFYLLKELVHSKVTLKGSMIEFTTKEIPTFKYSTAQTTSTKQVNNDVTDRAWNRNAFANAFVAMENDSLDDVGSQVKGNVDSFRKEGNVITLPAPDQQKGTTQVTKTKPTFSDMTRLVINDMPDGVYSFLQDAQYHRIKNKYNIAHMCSFRGRNIVQYDATRFIIYGPMSTDDNLIGVALLEEDEVDKVITKEPKASLDLIGTMDMIGYKRIVESEPDREWHGFGFVVIENVGVMANEESHPSC